MRATEVDKVELIACFRPGDLVRAAVLSLGDSRSYLLTTARNELGVVSARSATSGASVGGDKSRNRLRFARKSRLSCGRAGRGAVFPETARSDR